MAGTVYVQPVLVQQPAQTFMDTAAARRQRNKSTLFKLGIAEIVLGIMFIVTCIASMIVIFTLRGYMGFISIASGIWCGIFPITSGILGVCAEKKFTKCMFVANMVMAIFTAIFMAILFSLSVISALVVDFHFSLVLLQVLNCIGSFCLVIVAIVHSAYCCSGVCCYSQTQQGIPAGINPAYGQRFIQLQNGQFALIQNPPLVSQTYVAPQVTPGVGVVQPSTSAQYPQTQVLMGATAKPQTGNVDTPPAYDAHHFATNPNYM